MGCSWGKTKFYPKYEPESKVRISFLQYNAVLNDPYESGEVRRSRALAYFSNNPEFLSSFRYLPTPVLLQENRDRLPSPTDYESISLANLPPNSHIIHVMERYKDWSHFEKKSWNIDELDPDGQKFRKYCITVRQILQDFGLGENQLFIGLSVCCNYRNEYENICRSAQLSWLFCDFFIAYDEDDSFFHRSWYVLSLNQYLVTHPTRPGYFIGTTEKIKRISKPIKWGVQIGECRDSQEYNISHTIAFSVMRLKALEEIKLIDFYCLNKRLFYLEMCESQKYNSSLVTMNVLPFDEQLDHIPRSSENRHIQLTPDTLTRKSKIIFISHRWLRPSEKSPDDNLNSKWKCIQQALQHLASKNKENVEDYFLWVDYCCVNQDAPDKLSMDTAVGCLPFYVLCCDYFIMIDHTEYWDRAWCRLEQLIFQTLGSGVNLMHTIDQNGNLTTVKRKALDPLKGFLTNEDDRTAIELLMYCSESFTSNT